MTAVKWLVVVLLCWTTSIVDVIRVIDGDTFEARLSIWHNLFAVETIRLLGVDTPEMKGPTRPAAEAAKDFTEKWLVDHRDGLSVWSCKRDHFGRVLGGVTADGGSLTKALLDAGHGKPR